MSNINRINFIIKVQHYVTIVHISYNSSISYYCMFYDDLNGAVGLLPETQERTGLIAAVVLIYTWLQVFIPGLGVVVPMLLVVSGTHDTGIPSGVETMYVKSVLCILYCIKVETVTSNLISCQQKQQWVWFPCTLTCSNVLFRHIAVHKLFDKVYYGTVNIIWVVSKIIPFS